MMRLFRSCYRMPLLLLLFFIGLPIVFLFQLPGFSRISIAGETADRFSVGLWSRYVVRSFGLRVKRIGTPLPGPVLFVANHISWLDITVLHSQRWMCFVAKAEIERWPVIGAIAKRAGTIYHHRGDNSSLHGVMHQMLSRLQAGDAIGVFPEGRTLGGKEIGVFHARIFQPAILAEKPAQPVALKYGEKGCAQELMAFGSKENFFSNMMRVLGEPSRVCEVHFLEPVAVGADGRRKMADTCRQRIIDAMSVH
jgi:1-acyl-sn-glycerol-3-phosphate acyltransferase